MKNVLILTIAQSFYENSVETFYVWSEVNDVGIDRYALKCIVCFQ